MTITRKQLPVNVGVGGARQMLRKYFESLESGDLLGETFMFMLLGTLIGGYVGMVVGPIINLFLHCIAAVSENFET